MTVTSERSPAVTRSAPVVTRASSGDSRTAWGFLAPFGALYLLFILAPLAYGVLSSLFSASLVKPGLGDWIGLTNYADVLSSPDFWTSMRNTLLFTALTTVPLVVIGLVTAILVNRVGRAQ